MSEIVCGRCGRTGAFTATVAVVLVFQHGSARPFVLIPEEKYRICRACEAIFIFVDKAVAANSNTNAGGPWTRAVIVLDDGEGLDVNPNRKAERVARA